MFVQNFKPSFFFISNIITVLRKRRTCFESILASSLAFLIRLTIHRSASSGDIFNFSANMLMLIHWWIRQNVSKINKRAFSMKSSKQAIKKKSFNKTYKKEHIYTIYNYLSIWSKWSSSMLHVLILSLTLQSILEE